MNPIELKVHYEFTDEPKPEPCLEEAYRKRAEQILAEAALQRVARALIFWLSFGALAVFGTIYVLR